MNIFTVVNLSTGAVYPGIEAINEVAARKIVHVAHGEPMDDIFATTSTKIVSAAVGLFTQEVRA